MLMQNELQNMGGSRERPGAFTLTELLVLLAAIAILAALLLPAVAATKPDSRAFQCLNNQGQITRAWQMYAADNRDLLPPNDYPYLTGFWISGNKDQLKNWVVGTIADRIDASQNFGTVELTDSHSLLSRYLTNATVYHCPADNYIDPKTHAVHPRSYSMNSAVGTVWYGSFAYGLPLGTPVQGGWLPGSSYNANQTTWLTYGKLSSFTRPGPANTYVLIDENAYSINDGSFVSAAVAAPGATYLIDYAAGNHNAADCISFADGHVVTHQWRDSRTYRPQGVVSGSTRQTPDNPDCFYLAPITSARR